MGENGAKRVAGRDVSAPEQHIELNEHKYTLVYNNRAARVAEDVYEQQYGRDVGYYDILAEMAARKHRAIMAIIYGAMVAGGAEMTWDEFDALFTLGAIDSVRAAVQQHVLESLPKADEAATQKHE